MKNHLWVTKPKTTDYWCDYCHEDHQSWAMRSGKDDCPRRIISPPPPPNQYNTLPQAPTYPQQKQFSFQPQMTGNALVNTPSTVSCACGGAVWLYDPFKHSFNCVRCGNKQGKTDSSEPGPKKEVNWCECGSKAVGSDRHSSWCPLYRSY